MRISKYDMFSLCVTCLSLIVVALSETSFAAASIGHVQMLGVLVGLDTLACAFFIGEWLYELKRARNKANYIATHFLHLLGAIPFVATLRWLRVLRLVRLLRFVKLGIQVMRLWQAWTMQLVRNPFATLGTPALVVLVISATAFYDFERGFNPQLRHYIDALWWACVTMTTIGYGDIYPVTLGGRCISAITMLFGIGLIGSFTAAVASSILRGPDPAGPDLQDVILKLEELERQQATLMKALRQNK